MEDLYTLTYDEDSSMDQDEYESSHEKIINMKIPTGLISLQVTFNISKFTGCPQKKNYLGESYEIITPKNILDQIIYLKNAPLNHLSKFVSINSKEHHSMKFFISVLLNISGTKENSAKSVQLWAFEESIFRTNVTQHVDSETSCFEPHRCCSGCF